jgi:hypothetical protein
MGELAVLTGSVEAVLACGQELTGHLYQELEAGFDLP